MPIATFSTTKHSLLLLSAVTLAYFWSSVAFVQEYSLQIFAATILIYFLLKKTTKSKLFHIVPSAHSIELPLLTFAVLLLIGSTGNTESLFYPLGIVHLFFLVLSAHGITAVVTVTAIGAFHYLLAQTTGEQIGFDIGLLFVITGIFLIARVHYEQLVALTYEKNAMQRELTHDEQIMNTLKKTTTQKVIPSLTHMLRTAPLSPDHTQHIQTLIQELKTLIKIR